MEMETEWVVVEMENQAAEEEGMGMSWKALFLRRVVMADANCRAAHGLLEDLAAAFGEQGPLNTAAASDGPGEEETRGALEAASAELGLAAAHIGAARHLALRYRARPIPTDPAPPLSASAPASAAAGDEYLLADPEVRRALGLLRDAARLVRAVHDLVESARGHLGAAEHLRLALGKDYDDDDRDVAAGAAPCPWLHGPCASERLGGVLDVAQAWAHATELAETTGEARDTAFAFSDV
ncbi:uncharacterized protein LOC104584919 [Brachypodium distachyon]|uniref:Uncharacterized protein n=1 Tax=Brachypodium distachyon TaxID=15368 RepID=I1IJZ1_BRADI|nr:uncharacterized protein LOC104584919 [Brachypodium distachyon]KQJ87591.1 hypothetical protein BRADI_4g12120v3 [Brachypodium distachyon]|eukprot:XP_014757688.1 uncharacterized protein LOC104584919 [Brachypodium distachyon]